MKQQRVTTRKVGEIPGCRGETEVNSDIPSLVQHLPVEYRQGAIEELLALRTAPAGLLGLPRKS